MQKEELIPSMVSGDTGRPPLTKADIERYAKEQGISIQEFMKRNYLSEERRPNPKQITISGK